MNKVITGVVVLLLAGCAMPTKPIPAPRMAFPEAEYRSLQKSGKATVRGQAFLKTRGGDVKLAAGNQVYLNPVTSYSLAWYQVVVIQGQPMEPYDPRLTAYMQTQTADGNGRFAFKNVAAGEYFITTEVSWAAPTGYQGALQNQGGLVTKRIRVAEGEDLDVVITR